MNKKFNKGFATGDVIINKTERYIEVRNYHNGSERTYVVTDDGQRRERIINNGNIKWNPPLNKPALTGEMALSDVSQYNVILSKE